MAAGPTVYSAHEIWWDSHPHGYARWYETVRQQLGPACLEQQGVRNEILGVGGGLFDGVTTNPALIRKHLDSTGPAQRDARDVALFWAQYKSALRSAAEAGIAVWRDSAGKRGWVCGQVDPWAHDDIDAMVRQGVDLAGIAPNVMVKIPGSEAGFQAMEQLVCAGVSINATACFSVAQAARFCRAIASGGSGMGPGSSPTRHVYTLMLGRIGKDMGRKSRSLEDLLMIRWIEVMIARAVNGTLATSDVAVELLLSSIKVDGQVTDRAMHLTHTPPESIVTMPPSTITDILRDRVLLEEKISDNPPDPVRAHIKSSASVTHLFSEDAEASEFALWPQFVDALTLAQGAFPRNCVHA